MGEFNVERRMCTVLEDLSIESECTYLEFIDGLKKTIHIDDKTGRLANISRHIITGGLDEGKLLLQLIVDKGHKNGPEIHSVFDNGLIVVQNERTEKFITVQIARPGQILRYFHEGSPIRMRIKDSRINDLLRLCRAHQISGWNNW